MAIANDKEYCSFCRFFSGQEPIGLAEGILNSGTKALTIGAESSCTLKT